MSDVEDILVRDHIVIELFIPISSLQLVRPLLFELFVREWPGWSIFDLFVLFEVLHHGHVLVEFGGSALGIVIEPNILEGHLHFPFDIGVQFLPI